MLTLVVFMKCLYYLTHLRRWRCNVINKAEALFAPVLQPGNQYGATTKYAQFAARKGQISENIR